MTGFTCVDTSPHSLLDNYEKGVPVHLSFWWRTDALEKATDDGLGTQDPSQVDSLMGLPGDIHLDANRDVCLLEDYEQGQQDI